MPLKILVVQHGEIVLGENIFINNKNPFQITRLDIYQAGEENSRANFFAHAIFGSKISLSNENISDLLSNYTTIKGDDGILSDQEAQQFIKQYKLSAFADEFDKNDVIGFFNRLDEIRLQKNSAPLDNETNQNINEPEDENGLRKFVSGVYTQYLSSDGKIMKSVQDIGQGLKMVTTNDYDDQNRIISSNWSHELAKYNIQVVFNYDEEGNVFNHVQHIIEGKLEKEEFFKGENLLLKTEFDTNGSVIKSTSYTYNEAGKCTSIIAKDANDEIIEKEDSGYDENGFLNYESVYNVKNKTQKIFYGANIKGNLPSEEIVYENDGVTIKNKTIRTFGENGEIKSVQKLDGAGKILSYQDDFEMDDVVGTAYQGGVGDCYLLSIINAYRNNEKGHKLLIQNVPKSIDENGQTIYIVKLPGAEIASKDLKTRLPEDKVFIKGSYIVTQKEVDQAQKHKILSQGDPNVLLYELAFKKYRGDVKATVLANNINVSRIHYAGLESSMSDDDITGGWESEAAFIISGKHPLEWEMNFETARNNRIGVYLNESTHEAQVVNDIEYDGERNAAIANAQIQPLEQIKNDEDKDVCLSGFMKTSECSEEIIWRDKLIAKLIQDAEDGKLDSNSAACSIYVSYGGAFVAHAVAIVDINKDYVTIEDSNDESIADPRDDSSKKGMRSVYKIPMDKFLMACKGITVTNFD